jgi:signal recognition particle subunit SEC65
MFVADQIKRATKELGQKFASVKDVNPALKIKIENEMKSISVEIIKSVQNDIKNVNNAIADSFRIPDNVLLYSDRHQASKPTKSTEEELTAECADLEKISTEV